MNCKLLYCSFCGKTQHEVVKLIAGPQVFICDACTRLAMDIVLHGDAGEREYASWSGVNLIEGKEGK